MEINKLLVMLLELSARVSIVAFLMGISWTVYSNHNPIVLEYIWEMRIITMLWTVWAFIPFYKFVMYGRKGN